MKNLDQTHLGLLFGADYNPEQWPQHIWREDVALMREAGVNLVTLGVFSWGSLQPSPNRWNFGWLDEVIELLGDAHIAIDLATPTASPPPWFSLRHPEALAVRDDGVRMSHGSRNHYCPSAPSYREACLEVTGQLVKRYGVNTNVLMWHVGNEYGPTCYCDLCAAAFREWLSKRYGSLDTLNDAWGTQVWSQHYSSWNEILPPRVAPYLLNPSQTLDFRRFVSDQLLADFDEQAALIRATVQDAVVTTNFMGFFSGIDYRRWAPHMSIVTDDHYIDPTSAEGPVTAALTHELIRGLADGPWLLMEQAMGAVSWRQHNVPKSDSQRRNDVLRAIAHGADGVLSFQWRQSVAGSERFHSAMLPNAGPDTRLHRSVRRIGAELAKLSPDVLDTDTQSPVALLFDWPSWWTAEEASVPSRDRHVLEVLTAWFTALQSARVGVRVVGPHDNLVRYRAVFAPTLHCADQRAREMLKGLLNAGVPVVLGPFSLAVDEHDRLIPGPFPGDLTDLLGAHGEQWWPLPHRGVHVTSKELGDAVVHGWAELLVCDSAEILARFDDPDLDAAIVRSSEVPLYYLACDPEASQLDHLVRIVLESAGVEPQLGVLCEPPHPALELATRGAVTFVINSSQQAHRICLRVPARDILNEAIYEGTALVPPGAALALKEEPR